MAVMGAIRLNRPHDEIVGVVPLKVRVTVALISVRSCPAQDQASSPLVEHLSGAREESLTSQVFVKANPKITGFVISLIRWKPPRHFAGLIRISGNFWTGVCLLSRATVR